MAETLIPNCTRGIPSNFPNSRSSTDPIRRFPAPITSISVHSNPKTAFGFRTRSFVLQRRVLRTEAASSSSAVEEETKGDEESMSIDALHRFVDLNLGKWNGSFYQFDAQGNLLQTVSTKLSAGSYGEDELISLIQTLVQVTYADFQKEFNFFPAELDFHIDSYIGNKIHVTEGLYIKQPPSRTSIAGYDSEPEWMEYKIKETNMFTVDKYQQIGFFPQEKAFSLRYQTAGMLETVLRAGVLGEDDTEEETPRNLKIPSRQPSVVCENCLYSLEKDMRARAFHIMDPKGVLEMLLIFLEERGNEVPNITSCCSFEDIPDKLSPLLGRWEGHSMTKRSGVYGATIAEADTVALLEMDDKGQLIQDITSTTTGSSTTTNVHWTGTVSNNLVSFDGGFQLILLPGGMYMGCPCDIGKSVAQSQSFHLEFCWMESPEKRQRLVRTYDKEGLAVSSTYFYEIKV